MKPTVFIIILNWNGWSDTIECVNSCLKLTYPNFRIVVVDNGSEDGSEAALRKAFPHIDVLQTGANLGYAGGNNVGIRHALAGNADYVWLLNNDTVVDSGALGELVEAAQMRAENGMVGSKILSYADPSVIQYAGGRLDVDLGTSTHVGIGETDNHQHDQLMETEYITGCSLLVKRSVIERMGLMDEGYFLYFEESDWCVRAKSSGVKLMYAPNSLVYHKESVSTRKISGSLCYYMTRNRLYFISRNGTNRRWLARFRSDCAGLLKFLYHKDFVQARSMLDAYCHWLGGYRGRRDDLCQDSHYELPAHK